MEIKDSPLKSIYGSDWMFAKLFLKSPNDLIPFKTFSKTKYFFSVPIFRVSPTRNLPVNKSGRVKTNKLL